MRTLDILDVLIKERAAATSWAGQNRTEGYMRSLIDQFAPPKGSLRSQYFHYVLAALDLRFDKIKTYDQWLTD